MTKTTLQAFGKTVDLRGVTKFRKGKVFKLPKGSANSPLSKTTFGAKPEMNPPTVGTMKGTPKPPLTAPVIKTGEL